MSFKQIQTRISLKHDYEVNWNKAEGFIPLPGELIIYDADDDAPVEVRGSHNRPRFKVGDGVHNVIALPFQVELSYATTEDIASLFERGDS